MTRSKDGWPRSQGDSAKISGRADSGNMVMDAAIADSRKAWRFSSATIAKRHDSNLPGLATSARHKKGEGRVCVFETTVCFILGTCESIYPFDPSAYRCIEWCMEPEERRKESHATSYASWNFGPCLHLRDFSDGAIALQSIGARLAQRTAVANGSNQTR